MKTRKAIKCNCEMGEGELHTMECAVMELKPQHTPTPWNVIEDENTYEVIIDSKKGVIAKTLLNHMELIQAERNAKFIVRAVNSHEELVTLLKSIRGHLLNATSLTDEEGCATPTLEALESLIDKALAKAEGK